MIANPRILYLDDCPNELGQYATELCEHFHASIDVAQNIREAENRLQKSDYDLFLLDIEISGTRSTGIQFAAQIRKNAKYTFTPIIFISMHTYHSHRLLANLRYVSFLSKPFTKEQLFMHIGVALEWPEYLTRHYQYPSLRLPVSYNAMAEIDPVEISFIQYDRHRLVIQYINGQELAISRRNYSFQEALKQIQELHLDFLRQIYRSIIINVDQIRSVQMQGTTAVVWLFDDQIPKPLSYRYRKNIAEYLEKAE